MRVSLLECAILHMCASNDVNGNPRRAFVAVHPILGMVAAVSEGYRGTAAMREWLRPVTGPDRSSDAYTRDVVRLLSRRATRVNVKPSEVRQVVRAQFGAEVEAPSASEVLAALETS